MTLKLGYELATEGMESCVLLLHDSPINGPIAHAPNWERYGVRWIAIDNSCRSDVGCRCYYGLRGACMRNVRR